MSFRPFTPADGPPWLPRFADSIAGLFRRILPAPLRLKDYATADLPAAGEHAQGIVYDGSDDRPSYSNGSAWIQLAAFDADVAAIAALSTPGLIVRTGAGTAATRSIAGTTNQISVTNGDGGPGNPTLALSSTLVAPGYVAATTGLKAGGNAFPAGAGVEIGAAAGSGFVRSWDGSTYELLRLVGEAIQFSIGATVQGQFSAGGALSVGTASTAASGFILDARGNLRIGTGADISGSRSVLQYNQGGWGSPAAPGSISGGDKLVFYDPGASYRNAIGFGGGGEQWYQAHDSGFVWYTGATPTQRMALSATELAAAVVVKLPAFTVATLPASNDGALAFASNGRKTGEGGGAGTGVPVYRDGGTWYRFADDTAVAA